MKNHEQSVETNHYPNWPYIPDHPYRILFIGGSGSGKINVLLNLIKNQRKYQFLINEREKVEIKKLKSPKAFIDYSQTIDYAYESLENYNPTKKGEC